MNWFNEASFLLRSEIDNENVNVTENVIKRFLHINTWETSFTIQSKAGNHFVKMIENLLILLLASTSIASEKFDLKFNAIEPSELCNVQLNYFQENLDRNVLWARRMRDAWGNFPSGIFSGNLYDFGSFDQCIELQHYSEAVGEIIGQHCTILIPHNLHDESDRLAKFMPPSRRFETRQWSWAFVVILNFS